MNYVEEKLVVSIRYPLTHDFKAEIITNCEDTQIERVSLKIVDDTFNNSIKDKPVLDAILVVCANVFDISVSEIISKSRKQDFVNARFVFGYIGARMGFTFTEIGDKINRNRVTVYHYTQKILSELQYNKAFIEKYLRVMYVLGIKEVSQWRLTRKKWSPMSLNALDVKKRPIKMEESMSDSFSQIGTTKCEQTQLTGT